MKEPYFTSLIRKWVLCLFGLLILSSSAWAQTRTINGTVRDELGEPLPFVTVGVPGTTAGTTTDINGRFSLTLPGGATSFQVSFIGFKRMTVPVTASTTYDITLESEAVTLETVVVVGSIERNRESFTGAFNTVEASDLKRVGSQNLVESLKSLDASFVVMDNIAAGANPNVMPTIEVRGQTSINIEEVGDMYQHDPNQPLFILDGFETTLQQIIDLDFNRVASVTVLKDAASTAFYGSRAANGVVVVETVRSEVGGYRFFYTGDFSVQIPNIRSYNMMDAAEKLEFERMSGRYLLGGTGRIRNFEEAMRQAELDMLYASRLSEVNRGVNTDWMSQPLQTAFVNRQSVRMSGGTREATVNLGFSYRSAPGVMIGSKRDSWTGDIDFTFNRGKFTVVNRLGLSGFTAAESPYGSFSDWVRTNPYYRLTDTSGRILRYLDDVRSIGIMGDVGRSYSVANPLYNAGLGSIDETRNIHINERLLARWEFHEGMKLEGTVQLQSGNTNIIRFRPPEHTSFDNAPVERRGNYRNQSTRNLNWMSNLMYVWSNKIDKHSYVLNVRGELGHNGSNTTSWESTGFPMGAPGRPSFSNIYVDGRPGYRSNVSRRVNFLSSVNYSYNNRYLFDATIRLDGSTVFGSDQKYTPFWSIGTGWNIHEEDFMKPYRGLISSLRFRATIGQTGNQNIQSVVSTTTFNYLAGGNLFGIGIYPGQIGNPDVQWQKTTTTNFAIDLNMFDNRLTSKFEIYRKSTNPLVVSVDQAPSTGVSRLPMSLGMLTYDGFEFDISYAIIRTSKVHWRARLMGAMLDGVYSGFEKNLDGLNDAARNNNDLMRYQDNYSPKTLWAVPSLGIDPSSGREVFLDRFGQPTFYYNPDDIVAVASSEPKIMGTFNNFVTFGSFTLTLIMRYSFGAEQFNSALFNKVENISFDQAAFNQDRRALYDRWQSPGDIAEFRAINITTTSTPMSSRFIQKENFVSGESVGISWRFERESWIRHLGMNSMNLQFTATGTGGVFRISNIQRERGTSFPEATTLSLSINASF